MVPLPDATMEAALQDVLLVMRGVPVGMGGLEPKRLRNSLTGSPATGKELLKDDDPLRHDATESPKQLIVKGVSDVSYCH